MVQIKVEGLLFDPRSGMYILLLKQIDDNGTLPVWIGKPEADAIALAIGKVITPRPLTHDLVKNVFDELGVQVTKVVITEIIDNTYYALIYATDGNREVAIDSRPSDAVAIALRVESPIFVKEGVLKVRKTDELEEWLKNLKPEDFGNIM
ncbi:bifunctional nuclease family protein [Thermodesulfovibrionales bacterium]|nr:bifunctional nuclease family protein [Thermodesulfovibrionales bacterium]